MQEKDYLTEGEEAAAKMGFSVASTEQERQADRGLTAFYEQQSFIQEVAHTIASLQSQGALDLPDEETIQDAFRDFGKRDGQVARGYMSDYKQEWVLWKRGKNLETRLEKVLIQ